MWLQAPAPLLARVQARLAAETAAADDTDAAVIDPGEPSGSQPGPQADADADEMDLAEIPGWGVVLPDTARKLARQAADFTQVGVDDDGRVVTLGDRVRTDRLGASTTTARSACPLPPAPDRFLHQASQSMRRPPVKRDLTGRRYRPGSRLTRLLQARDRTCVFPGCQRIATRVDLDHRIPWPGGATSVDNPQCLCRHHHRAKHAVFIVSADPDGAIIWITRGGWIFRRHPRRHRPHRRPEGD